MGVLVGGCGKQEGLPGPGCTAPGIAYADQLVPVDNHHFAVVVGEHWPARRDRERLVATSASA